MKLKFTIKSKIQIAALIVVLGIIIASAGYLYYDHRKNSILLDKYQELKAITDLKESQIEKWLRERIADARVLVNSPFLIAGIKNWLDNQRNMTLTNTVIKRLLATVQEYGYEDIFIMTPDGTVLLSIITEPDDPDTLVIQKISEATRSRQPAFTDLYFNTVKGKIYFDIVVPLVDNEKIEAFFLLRRNPNRFLYPLIQSWPIPSRSAETVLLRMETDSIVFLNELRHQTNTALKLKLPMTRAEIPGVQGALGRTGMFEGKDYRGVEVLSDIRKIAMANWIMVSKVDKNEILAELHTEAAFITGFCFLLLALAGTGLVWIYNRRQRNIYMELYKKEKELWQQNEKFKITMDSLGDGVIVTDIHGKVQYINNSATDLTGWRLREAKGKYLDDIYPVKNEETGRQENNILLKVLMHGIVKELANHTILISKSGKEIPVMDTGAPIYDSDDTVIGIVIAFHDETEKRTQQRLLKKSEEQFREIFENSAIGKSLTEIGGTLNFNNAFCAILGYTEDELRNKNWKEITHPDDIQESEQIVKSMLEGKVNSAHYEKRYLKKNGETVWCEVHTTLLRDVNDLPKYFLTAIVEINERKKAEDKLRESEKRYRLLFDQSPIGIGIADLAGNVLAANPMMERLTGYSMEELKSVPLTTTYVNPADRKELLRILSNSGHIRDWEVRLKRKEGVIYDALLNIDKIEMGGKQVLFTNMRDITEQKIAEEKIKENDRLKTAFINNISHEMRTPLNGILGFGELLTDTDLSTEERAKFCTCIKESCDRLLNTVSDYMDMAMIVSGTMKVHKKPFLLYPLIAEVYQETKKQCLKKQTECELSLPAGMEGLILNSDKILIKTVIQKLTDNAIKFTDEGKIMIGFQAYKGSLKFFVSDTGRGIARENLQAIFDMFTQEDTSMTRGYDGSGLGLSIAKGIIDLLGGNISVASEKGKGSTFYFTIPWSETMQKEEPARPVSTSITGAEKPLVLVAEDDESNYHLLEVVLKKARCDYLYAANGAAAVELCKQNPDITLVLMDVMMPVMNGAEATRLIREFRPDLPIIALTAYAHLGDEHNILNAGCNEYYSKPVRLELLNNLIKKYTTGR